MGQFAPAFDYLMGNEDPERACAVVADSCPEGCTGPCFAISGINSGAWPEWYGRLVLLAPGQRLPVVSAFYEQEYWAKIGAGGLVSQDVADRVLDCDVNEGERGGGVVLQEAINLLHAGTVAVDGAIGPETLEAANGCEPDALVAAIRTVRSEDVRRIAAEKGWSAGETAALLARAGK